MTNKVQIVDHGGTGVGLCIHNREGDSGAVVYTKEFAERISRNKPFLNPTWGNAMNQDASFGGTPVLIHNGGDTAAWTGAAGAGTWDFADTTNPFAGTRCVSVTSANNLDNATFTNVSTITGSSYTALTLELRLEAYNDTNNSIDLQLALAGVNQGISVNLDNYIDAAVLNVYQNVVIPLTD